MSKKSNQPQFLAFSIKDSEQSENGYWTRIGAAFAHQNGDGYTLILDWVPLDGKVILRKPKEPDAKA
jgi:hypothetical protein